MPTPIASPSSPLQPRKASSKKYPPIASTPSPSPSPLRPSAVSNRLPMNDDAAERAARRKSARFGDLGVSTGSTGKENAPGGPGQPQLRKASALAAQQAQAQAGGQARRAKRLSAVVPTAPPVSMEVMNTNFEEWMKLATDNKITATNTWNFALIDYFHDLTLLRNGPDDQSINFQKASCTLDGCVKIWTSRVDSVATETGKLLSGLAGGNDEHADDDDEQLGDEDEAGEGRKASRKTHRSEATLAKSFATLQVKKFDLEFTVDPLFKKTSADFDEGGAMGLLMNHLGVDGKGRVVFDAGDAGGEDEEEEEEPEEELIDISALRELMPPAEEIALLNISDTLATFRFTSDPNDMPDFSTVTGVFSSGDDGRSSRDVSVPVDGYNAVDNGGGGAVDFFGDDDYDIGTVPMDGFDDTGSVVGDEGGYENELHASRGGLGMTQPGEGHGPFDPRRQPGQELVMAFNSAEDNDSIFRYFDQKFNKTWAGAEHWKLRKVTHKDPATVATEKPKRAPKAPFTIDFINPSAAQSSDVLFEAPKEGKSKESIQMPSTSRGRKSTNKSASTSRKDEWLLPDDMHFSSRQLLRLFLKPKFSLRMRRNGNAARMAANTQDEVDKDFWVQAAAERAEGEGGFDDMGIDSAPIPFDSQFFHDDGDDGDDAFVDDILDEGLPGGGEEEDDLWQSTQGQELRRVKPENVHFAKKAKRVDVKRLKDDIWNDLKGLVPDTDSASSSDVEMPQTPAEPVKTFDTVIQSLRSNYPREKMSEISTSFCFICLLHLANEEGLRIETARTDGTDGYDVGMLGLAEIEEEREDDEGVRKTAKKRMDEGDRVDRIVGELQALKVYKDPNAGRSA